MEKKEIKKLNKEKINQLKKNNEAYFLNDNPVISDGLGNSLLTEDGSLLILG